MSDLASLLDYIDRSTENLNITLKGIITSQTLRYDVIYENFLKTIEQYKINLFSELKTQLIPGFNAEDSSNEVNVLQQMKLILNVKIRDCITELNLASTPSRKEEIISHLGILNDSLQKIEKNIFESKNLLSPLSQSMMSQNFTHLEDIDQTLDNKNKTVITPLPQKKEKVSSDINTKLTPLLSESAENKKHAPFKTPNQYSSGQPNTIPKSVSQITSAPKSDETHVTKLNSFNKTNEKFETSTTPNQNSKSNNSQSVSLFEMFDHCLNSIVQNKNDALLINNVPESSGPLRSPTVSEERKEYKPRFQTKANEEKKLKGLFNAMHKYLLRRSLITWNNQTGKISLPNFDNDFDLLHGNIAGMHELDMPKDHDEFYLKTKDFSLILNREEIMKDYTQDNLLSTQLSFCEGNMDEMNFEELGRTKPSNNTQNKVSTQQYESEPKDGGDKSSRKIKEPTNFDDSKSKLVPNLDTRKSSIGSLINQNSSQKIKQVTAGPVKASISGNGQALAQKTISDNNLSASKRPNSRAVEEKKPLGEKEKPKTTVRSSSNSRVTTNTSKIPNQKALNSSSKVSAAKENNKIVSPIKSVRLSNYNSTK